MKRVATHNSNFHADDVFAVAALSLLLNGEYKLIRTRDSELIEKSDYAVDVDWVYDPARNRFDHHQKGGAGERENGIPYAGFGLVWKHYGEKICESKYVSDIVDVELVQPIDASDNGINISTALFSGVKDFSISKIISSYLPTWKEDQTDMDDRFKEAVNFAVNILRRQIEIAKHELEASKIIESIYEKSDNKQIIVFDELSLMFSRKLITKTLLKYDEVIYFVNHKPDIERWQIVAMNKNENTSDLRKPFPESWRGTLDEATAIASGVPDATVCHRRGFMCIAKSKEGAILLAEKALKS